MSSHHDIIQMGDVRGWFHERFTDVVTRRGIEVEAETGFYVVNLLAEFARAEQLYDDVGEGGRRESPALALLLARALEQPPRDRVRTLKRLGDRSLYISGFFADSLTGRGVDVDYYIAMGERAYGSAADLAPSAGTLEQIAAVFEELARKFGRLVDCLMEISEDVRTTRVQGMNGLVQLYERWMATGSPRLAQRLAAEGLIPGRPGRGGWVQ